MVTLLYFAKVREAIGKAEERIDLPEGVSTVADLANWLARRHPIFADRDRLRVAVDQVMARFDKDIGGAKEIAFFPTGDGRMITVRVSPEPFDAGAEIAALGRDCVGAVASFVGIVRGNDGLTALTLEHYPAMTETALRTLADEAARRWTLDGVTLHHRVGRLVPGDPIVLVACASAHRKDTLEACAFLIDRLKTDAPFWKRESFADGREEWVEARTSDDMAAARWN